MRGPIVFVAEDVDNSEVEEACPHFDHVGLSESASFSATRATVAGVDIVALHTEDVYVRGITSGKRSDGRSPLYSVVRPGVGVRSWSKASQPLTFIPWFARGNRGGKGGTFVFRLCVWVSRRYSDLTARQGMANGCLNYPWVIQTRHRELV
jgi:hypothetical protein